MSYKLSMILIFSVLIPGVTGLIRFKKIERGFHPFIFLIWMACVNEGLSFYLESYGRQTIINNNIYGLAEPMFITWFFFRLSWIKKYTGLFLSLVVIFFLGWLLESFIMNGARMTAYFNIFYSFAIVMMSISTLNYLLVRESSLLLKNAVFWICMGFIIFFTFNILIFSFWLYGLVKHQFLLQMYYIRIYVDCLTNFIFAFAILWIPKTPPSTLL